MSETTIVGVQVKKLQAIPDERGRVMELLRSDDELFDQFGQVYLTTAYPGVVKAWHAHERQTDHFAVIGGMAKIALYDGRKESASFGAVEEYFSGQHNPLLIKIPPGVYHGFKAIGDSEVLLINIPSEPFNRNEPDEQRLDPYENDIPYNWKREDR